LSFDPTKCRSRPSSYRDSHTSNVTTAQHDILKAVIDKAFQPYIDSYLGRMSRIYRTCFKHCGREIEWCNYEMAGVDVQPGASNVGENVYYKCASQP